MCGIWALINRFHITTLPPLSKLDQYVCKIIGRGPEGMRIKQYDDGVSCALGFTRLAINGLTDAGMQPFEYTAPDGSKYAWICNGEIYNWKTLAADYNLTDTLTSGSDCEIIGPLYHILKDDPVAFARAFDGVFAIVLVDFAAESTIVLRDPYGVRPLFYGVHNEYTVYASEMKSIYGLVDTSLASQLANVQSFKPGHIQITSPGEITYQKYHTVPYEKVAAFNNLEAAEMAIEKGLRLAVRKRLMTERPCAALLSGGVDSSLIAAIVADELRVAGVERPLETFSIGFEGSEDLRHARMVAEWISSKHHEIIMTADEFFAAIPEVVRAIESFDITTVRASVGNYLVSKAIREQSDCKVVFNGDGSDEIFGSYLYFYKAPNDHEFERETHRLLEEIHYFDVLRSDRSISSHGLEPRTPFLDKSFVATAMSLPTKWRRPGTRHAANLEPICEKWILRRAFMDSGLLPPEVLWRRKEAFSDGVSGPMKSWYEEIQERVEALVPDNWTSEACEKYNKPAKLQPHTAEAFYYRSLFESFYGEQFSRQVIPHFWMPRWIEGATDPSARKLAIYNTSEQKDVA